LNPYFLLPLGSALACMAFGLLILAREPEATSHRCTGALLLGAAWWGICEALWTLAPDADTALLLVRLSTPGWIAVGPICLHLFLAQVRRPAAWIQKTLPGCYALAALFAIAALLSPEMERDMGRVPWGWSYHVGWLYLVWYAFTVLTASTGIFVGLRELRSGSPAESRQSPWLGAGIGAPLLIGSSTDGLLPTLGVPFPRLGVLSFAVFGALITWSIRRFGYSLIAPGNLAGQILQAMPEGVALATPDGRIRLANRSLAVLLGTPLAALIEQPVGAFLPGLDLSPTREPRELECEIEALAAGRLPVALSTAPLRDKQGTLIGLVLVVRDLREVASLRSRLLTSARLAAVGELAAGIAHEINNPLAYIGTNLRSLREQWRKLADARRSGAEPVEWADLFDEGIEMLDESLEGVERAAAIVRDVRVFSHGGSGERERLDPNELLDRALRVAEPQLRHRASVERHYGEVPPVAGARRELEQVFLNLIVNAAQSLDGLGTLRLRTALVDGEVEIAVTDTGRGIAPELLDRIFDPFFTTKPVGEGTGLGLSISHEIVRRHGGRIDVASELGRGTEISVRLPAADAL
jgi:signal transduction histidine kinase